jgi:hypothetical protein
MATALAVIVMVLTVQLWVALAFVFGAVKFLATFSLSAAWAAFKSVPVWIWDFTYTTLS